MSYSFFNIYLSEADYDAKPKETKNSIKENTLKLQEKIKNDFLNEIKSLVKEKTLIIIETLNDRIRMQILNSKEEFIYDLFRKSKNVSVIDKDYDKFVKETKELKKKEIKSLKRFMK